MESKRFFTKNSHAIAFLSLFAIIAAVLHLGWDRVCPTSLQWLEYDFDPNIHFLGWSFFRGEAWSFPLGNLSSYVYPLGSSVASTDSIPLFAFLFKFFSPILPDNFQYFGLWAVFCMILNGVTAYFLFLKLTKNQILYSIIGAALFIWSPVVLFRFQLGHYALCAHWILLSGFLLYEWSKDSPRFKKVWIGSFLLTTLSCLIHPYLLVLHFVVLLSIFLLWFFYQKDFLRAGGILSANLVLALLLLGLLGYFNVQTNTPSETHYRYFSSDLLAFFNSRGLSTFLPAIRSSGRQEEGYAYLGLAGVLLFLWLLVRKIFRKKLPTKNSESSSVLRSKNSPLYLCAILMFIYSLSAHVSFGGNTILRIYWPYNLIEPIPTAFASGGRFIWFPYYVLAIYLLLQVFQKIKTSRRFFWISVALLGIHVIDLLPLITRYSVPASQNLPVSNYLSDPRWKNLGASFTRLEMIPPFESKSHRCFGGPVEMHENYYQMGYFAARYGLQYNSGFSARGYTQSFPSHCLNQKQTLLKNQMTDSTLFVVGPEFYSRKFFEMKLDQNLKCLPIEKVQVCVGKNHSSKLVKLLQTP